MPFVPNLNPAVLTPPFADSLPAELRMFGEESLLRNHLLTRHTYSTAAFLTGAVRGSAKVLNIIPVANGFDMQCEANTPELLRYCEEHNLQLAETVDANLAAVMVQAALDQVIKPYSFLWHAISELAWRFHIVEAEDDDYDVSFSDPSIPFSIFVSAPKRKDKLSVLRVAENLVHETMHLQLSLFEAKLPLVDPAVSWSMYSPWKRQERPAQGILHGLYVFHVLKWMWQTYLLSSRDDLEKRFALRRVSDIEIEIGAAQALQNSPSLTEHGSAFLKGLFPQ